MKARTSLHVATGCSVSLGCPRYEADDADDHDHDADQRDEEPSGSPPAERAEERSDFEWWCGDHVYAGVARERVGSLFVCGDPGEGLVPGALRQGV